MLYGLDGMAPTVPEGEDWWVAPGAHVMGNVVLAEGVGIWFGAVLRGDNEPITVGVGTNIQENAVCHTDMGFPLTIGAHCTIGHTAIIHGCTIGDESLIGMGATVLNGAQIGRNCLVGAGALVTEGKEIPDGSLVIGAPARVVRALSADEIAGLRASAEGYQANMRRFRAALVASG
ncbi:MAG: gamma carbonic anhydrase family protein [Pseudomonadota bacterium]